MNRESKLIDRASDRIIALIKHHAGGVPDAAPSAVARLCRDGFGLPTVAVSQSLDFYGQVDGEIGGDNARVLYNSAHPPTIQSRVLIHELAEYLASRDMPGLWDNLETTRFQYTGQDSAGDIRHKVAKHVETSLAAEMGLDSPTSSWRPSEILRLIPLDPKYADPTNEIERIPAEDL